MNSDTWKLISSYQFYDEEEMDSNKISFIEFSPNSKYCIIGHDNAYLISVNNGQLIHDFKTSNVNHIDFINNGNDVVLTLTTSSAFIIYNIETNQETLIRPEIGRQIYSDYLIKSNNILVISDIVAENAQVTIYNLNFIEKLFTFDSEIDEIKNVYTFPNEKYVIIDNGIWDLQEGIKVNSIAEGLGNLEVLKISSDSKWIATRHEDKIIRIWDVDKLIDQNTNVKHFDNY